MPQATTTSVSVGSILDLIGPGTPSCGTARDGAAFDALLKPFDSKGSAAPPRDENLPEISQQPPIAAGDSIDSSGNQPQGGSREQPPSLAETVTDGDDPQANDDEQPSTDDSVLVESLAALAAARPPLSADDGSAITEVGSESAGEEAELAATGAHESSPVTPAEVIAAGEIGNTVILTEAAAAEFGGKQSANASRQEPVTQTDLKGTVAVASALATDSRYEAGVGKNGLLDRSNETNGDSPDQLDDHRANDESLSIDLTSAAENGQLAKPTAAETANQATAAPLTAQPAVLDSASGASSTSPASAIAAPAPSNQPRLPVEALVPTAGVSHRRPAIAIDSARLLTRVARAFAAAQERDGEIRLRLSPPELGALRLEVRIWDGAMVAHLQTENDAARSAIIENLPALRERLADQGVKIERFNVDLMHRQAGDTPGQPGWQEPEVPARPRHVLAVSRPGSGSFTSNPSAPAVGSTGGLNVIV